MNSDANPPPRRRCRETLQAQADALRPRDLVGQQRIGFHLGDIGGKERLTPLIMGLGAVIDIDHRKS
jgi:hypothetical protein